MNNTDKGMKIFYSNDQFFLWNVDDIKLVRKQFRVVGNLIGTLNLKGLSAYQNKLHSLPLQLMIEECVYLLNELKDVRLVIRDLNSIDVSGLANEFEEYDNQMLNDYKRLHHQRSVDELKAKIDQIIENKALKEKVNVDQLDREEILNKQIEKIRPITESNRPKQLFTQSPWLVNLKLISVKDEQGERLKLKHKLTKHQLLRHLVYNDLNRKGLYLTKGNKFGSDFLAYACDPLFCHASYLVICLADPQQLSKTILQTYSRLGSQVNKHILLVKFDDDSFKNSNEIVDKIEYLDQLNMLIKDKKIDLDYMTIKWRSEI